MKCFEVTINGEKLCTAGVEDGVLTSILAYVKRAATTGDEHEGHTGEKVESLDIRVGGLENISYDATANIDWLIRDLSIGDEIRIRIIDSPVCDEPMRKEITYIECSFCGKRQSAVKKLIAGPAVYICNECVEHCSDAVAPGEPMGSTTMVLSKQAEAPCSFCGKKPVEVDRIVGVPTARICSECLKICDEILAENA